MSHIAHINYLGKVETFTYTPYVTTLLVDRNGIRLVNVCEGDYRDEINIHGVCFIYNSNEILINSSSSSISQTEMQITIDSHVIESEYETESEEMLVPKNNNQFSSVHVNFKGELYEFEYEFGVKIFLCELGAQIWLEEYFFLELEQYEFSLSGIILRSDANFECEFNNKMIDNDNIMEITVTNYGLNDSESDSLPNKFKSHIRPKKATNTTYTTYTPPTSTHTTYTPSTPTSTSTSTSYPTSVSSYRDEWKDEYDDYDNAYGYY